MNRRSTLLALGGAVPMMLAARGLRAQTADTAPVTPADYMLATLQYGTVAKETSMIAKTRSGSNYVKDFAQGEILEQRAIAAALTSQLDPKSPRLTKNQKMVVETVINASDAEFDNVYLLAQINGHKSLLALQMALIAEYPTPDTDMVHVALIAEAFIRNHLFVLNQLYTPPS